MTSNAGSAPYRTCYTSIYYIHKGWNTLANTDFHKLCSQHKTQPNSAQFKHPVCHLIFLSQLQAASPTPHHSRHAHARARAHTYTHTHTHPLHNTSQTDRHSLHMTQSLLYFINDAHNPQKWTNLQWHKAQYVLNIWT